MSFQDKSEDAPSGSLDDELGHAKRDPETANSHDASHESYFHSISWMGSMMAVTFSYLAVYMGPLLVVIGLPVVEQAFGNGKDSVFIPATYTIGQCIGMIITGRISDIVGRRWFVISGNALAMIGWLVSGRAGSLATNIGGTFLFGLGSGVQILSVLFVLELVPMNRRYLTYAYIISAWGSVIAFAPGAAFTFIQTADQSWKWINYIAFMVSTVSFFMHIVFYHPVSALDTQNETTSVSATKKIDFIGTFLGAASTVSFLLGVYLGGQRYPWHSARTIVPIVLGGVGWIATLGWEYLTRSKYTYLGLPLLRSRNFVTLTLVVSLISMAWQAPTMLFAQQIAAIDGANALLAGWYDGIVTGSPILGQIIAGAMATGFPMLQPQLIIACILPLAFIPALAAYTLTQISMVVVFVVASGAGVGIVEIITVVGATSAVSIEEFGIAAAVLWTTRKVATSIANAIYTAVLANKVQANLLKYVVPVLALGGLSQQAIEEFLQALGEGDSTALSKIPGVTAQILLEASTASKTAYAKSFKVIYLSTIAFSASALIVALLVSNSALDKTKTPLVSRKVRDIVSEGISFRSLVRKGR